MQTHTPEPDRWHLLNIEDIQSVLGSFRSWVLCGGCSIDWLLNKSTRQHGDTDIGVFRSDLQACLETIGTSRVYLCDPPGHLKPWDSAEVTTLVHDIWVTDATHSHWVLQIMVYDDDDNERVVYRRDDRITWSKSQHDIVVRGVRILNPVITLLFKLHRSKLEEKDCIDVRSLIEAVAVGRTNNVEAGWP
ncbi:MAG: hypothetical protein WA949_16010 [Phormidesmis sp.]